MCILRKCVGISRRSALARDPSHLQGSRTYTSRGACKLHLCAITSDRGGAPRQTDWRSYEAARTLVQSSSYTCSVSARALNSLRRQRGQRLSRNTLERLSSDAALRVRWGETVGSKEKLPAPTRSSHELSGKYAQLRIMSAPDASDGRSNKFVASDRTCRTSHEELYRGAR